MAQQFDDGYLELHGVIYKYTDESRVSSVKIKVTEGDKLIRNGFSRKGGRFRIDLPLGSLYTFEFVYPAYKSMYMEVDTRVPDKDMGWKTSAKVNIPLFEENRTDLSLDVLDEMPFFKLVYNPKVRSFAPDPEHLAKFADRLSEPAARPADDGSATADDPTPTDAGNEVHDSETTTDTDTGSNNTDSAATNAGSAADDYPEPPPPAEIPMDTEEATLAERKRAREEEIAENKEIKQEHERKIMELAEQSETGKVEPITPDQRAHGGGPEAIAKSEHDTEIKQARSSAAEEARERDQEKRENQAVKHKQDKLVLIAMAEDEKQRKMAEYARSGDNALYGHVKPTIETRSVEERFQTTKYTIVKFPGEHITYRKVSYVWGPTYYYRNDTQLEQSEYDTELGRYTNNP